MPASREPSSSRVVRFLADADLNQKIVTGARRREPAIDFRSATDARLAGLHDRDVLALAAASNRVLVTHDMKSMPRPREC